MNLIPWDFNAWLLMGKPEIKLTFKDYGEGEVFPAAKNLTNLRQSIYILEDPEIQITIWGYPGRDEYEGCNYVFNRDTGAHIRTYHNDDLEKTRKINKQHKEREVKIKGFLVP